MGRAASAVAKSSEELKSIAALDPVKAKDAYIRAGQRLNQKFGEIFTQNFFAAGLESDTGTMLKALRNPVLFTSESRVVAKMRPNIRYKGKDGKAANPGDLYAAAGSFRYGAVRQPLTKKKGSLYKDLSTGEMRPRKYAAGEYGDRAKRTIKAKILRGVDPAKPSKKFQKGIRATQAGTVVVLPPRPPYFQMTEAQRKSMEAEWAAGLKQEYKALGLNLK